MLRIKIKVNRCKCKDGKDDDGSDVAVAVAWGVTTLYLFLFNKIKQQRASWDQPTAFSLKPQSNSNYHEMTPCTQPC